MAILFVKQYDTLPNLQWQILDSRQCPLNLTTLGVTKVTFTMVKADRYNTPRIIEAPAEIADLKKGLLQYRWSRFDTIYTGWHYAWFTVYFASALSGGARAAGAYEGVVYLASTIGEIGNEISLVFDGVKNIGEVVGEWNFAHPDNQVTHNANDVLVIPTAYTVDLVGGVNQIENEQRISYPDQKEKLEVTVEGAFGQVGNQQSPPPPSISDWLAERRREDFALIGVKNGENKTFTTSPFWFTINEAFKIKVRLNGRILTRDIDYRVYSSNSSKQGYNTIIFEENVYIPQSTDILLADFYISDSL